MIFVEIPREEVIYTIGPPPLPVLPQLLTAQTRRLVYGEEGQNLLHSLGVSVIHHCGGWRNDSVHIIRPEPSHHEHLGRVKAF